MRGEHQKQNMISSSVKKKALQAEEIAQGAWKILAGLGNCECKQIRYGAPEEREPDMAFLT